MIEIPIVVSSSAQIRITITKRHDHYTVNWKSKETIKRRDRGGEGKEEGIGENRGNNRIMGER